MSQVLEAGCAYDTPPPPSPFTGVYADSPRPSEEAEHFQQTPRWIQLGPFSLAGEMQQDKQPDRQLQSQLQPQLKQQLQPQLQPQLQRSEQGDLVRWYPQGTDAVAPSQGQHEASQPCGAEQTESLAHVEIHLTHPVATRADPSRANHGPSVPGFGGQSLQNSARLPPPACVAIDASVRRLHDGAHRIAARSSRSWSPPMRRRTSAITPPSPWVQPRLSAVPHKAVLSPVHSRPQPSGKRLSGTASAGPASCATGTVHAKLSGLPGPHAWHPNKPQASRWQRVEVRPLMPPKLPRQVSGSVVIVGPGMPSRATASGLRAFAQLQGRPQVCSSGACGFPGVPAAARLPEASGDVQKHVAAGCTPALSTRRKVRRCCSLRH